MHSYDSYGWLSAEEIPGRTTSAEPPAHGDKVVGDLYPNWTGVEWVLVPYFEPIIPAPITPTLPNLTKLEYMNRFTDIELVAIYTAAKVSVEVEIWLEKFKLAEFVNPQDPTTIAGLQALETAGLLAQGRAAEILA